MPKQPPKLIAIDYDDYLAKHVGHTADGRQFFLTTPFEPGESEFVALFLFDKKGKFLEARIADFGSRTTMDKAKSKATYDSYLRELGKVTFQRITVAPFSIERFDTTFGLIIRELEEDDDDDYWVELHPGNYMAFHEPWDSGQYDT